MDIDRYTRELVALHEQLETNARQLVETYDAQAYFCQTRCNECCSSYFKITCVEALRLRDGFAALEPNVQARCLQRAGETCRQLEWYGDALDRHLEEAPSLAKAYDASEQRDVFFIQCPLLGDDGLCLVYPHRPLTCNAFGQPRWVPNQPGEADYCYKNFRELNSQQIPRQLIIDYQAIVRKRNEIERQFYRDVLGEPVDRIFKARIAEFLVLQADQVDWRAFLQHVMSPAYVAMEFIRQVCPKEAFEQFHAEEQLFHQVCQWHEQHGADPGVEGDLEAIFDQVEEYASGGRAPQYSLIRKLIDQRGSLFLGYLVLNISQRYLSA